ncbi:MAG TPA: GTPase HflX [Bacillota bacterium]|nr:GTPase HflX [Bacillota bacterium]
MITEVTGSSPERAVLFSIAPLGAAYAEVLLDELEALLDTAGAISVGRMLQVRSKPEPGTYLGKGKIQELKDLMHHLAADLAVCDDELTPAQLRNLEESLECRVVDRTQLILDIFAQRARSAEGKLQVEAAQLAYALPRLRGKGVEMSNPGAGIGTRGPGETKLETDRRKIRSRIADLKGEIEELSRQRGLIRANRQSRGIATVALVGYTNAGKSTLLNSLTEGGAFAENRLFATLDPTSREAILVENRRALFVDTVGFIRKLPHQLVKAFRATLEEVQLADVLVHVIDASSADLDEQVKAVDEVLGELAVLDKPIVLALNKCDLVDEIPIFRCSGKPIPVSAVTGHNLTALREAIAAAMSEQPVRKSFLIPFSRGDLLSLLHAKGDVKGVSYLSEGTSVDVELPLALASKVESELAKCK